MEPADETRELTDAEKAEAAKHAAEMFYFNVVGPHDDQTAERPPESEPRDRSTSV